MEFQLKGWPAVFAIVLGLAAFLGYRGWLHSNPKISAELKQKLEFNMISEISGALSGDTEAIQAALQRGDRATAERLAQGVLKRRVELDDFDFRGSGDDMVVRANYTLHGPEGAVRKTGYYRYSYSTLTGWQYQYETTVWSWRMKLF